MDVRSSCISHGVSFHWRNSGENLIMDGDLMTGLTLRQQDSICDAAGLDYMMDDVFPKQRQTKLF